MIGSVPHGARARPVGVNTMTMPEAFDTTRLGMRRLRRDDAPDLLEYCSDAQVTRYMHWRTQVRLEEIEQFIEGCVARWESGEEYCWAISARRQPKVFGHIACRVRGYEADLGYVIHREHWGRGLGTEAARAVVERLLQIPSLVRISATCDAENTRSARVLERVGMKLEGRQRRKFVRPNIGPEPRDVLLYARVRDGGSSAGGPR